MEHGFFKKRPAVRIVLLLIIGILSASYIPITPPVMYILVVLFVLTYGVFAILQKRSSTQAFLLNLTVVLIGFFLYSLQSRKIESERLVPSRENESIVFQGSLDAEPFEKGSYHQLVVTTSSLLSEQGEQHLQRRILVYAKTAANPQLFENLHAGSVVIVQGTLEPFPLSRNPGEFDYGRYLELQEIEGVARVTEEGGLQLVGKSDSPSFSSFFASLRRSFSKTLGHYSTPHQANFLKGVILGDRGDIAPELKQSFIDTGTIHILAVSGFNVGIIVVICFSVFSLFRLPKAFMTAATIIVLIGHMFLTGATASVVRATLMATVLLIGTLLERKTDVYNSLGVAALVILLWDPKQIFDVGFQLSFAAVLSIVYFYPLLVELIRNIPEKFKKVKVVDDSLKLLAVSIAAQLGTIPFTAYYFGRISVVSLLTNLFVVPLVSVNTILGFVTIAVAFFSPWAATCYAAINNVLVGALLWIVTVTSKAPLAYIATDHLTASFPFFYYIGVVGVFNFRKPLLVRYALILVLLALNVVTFSRVFAYKKPVLVLTALDVGQGDAIVLELPNGKHVVIDAGAKGGTFDAGEKVLVPFLKRKGITSLDAVVVTHAHSDHLGGVSSLLKHIRVERIFESSITGGNELPKRTKELARAMNIPIQDVQAGTALDFGPEVRAYVLHPHLPVDSTTHLNDASVVLKIIYGNTSLLLVGDAESESEEKMMNRYAPLLHSDVLKTGHHGSITSSSEEFLGKVKPTFAIISVGRYNKFGHPSPAVIARLKIHQIQVRRTDYAGAAVIESDGFTIDSVQWRKTYFN